MALINYILQPRNFELIRDRIGLILADEIANQFTLTSNSDINATVYVERLIPFDKTEMPCINVLLDRGDFDNISVKQADGTYNFFIDVYAKSLSTQGSNGDKLSAIALQKIVGLVYSILEDTQYRTLAFAAPSVQHTQITNFQIAGPQNNQDAVSTTMARLIFSVKITESVKLLDADDIQGWETSVTLAETDKGYVFTKFP